MLFAASIAAAILLLLLSSNAFFAFDLVLWTFHPGIVVAVHAALRRPFTEATALMLLVAYVADLLHGGPPGVHALLLSMIFLAIQAIARRVGGRYALATFLLAFGGSLLLDVGESLLLTLFYPASGLLDLLPVVLLPTALLTGLVALPYAALLGGLERLWRRRTERSIQM